MTPDVVLHAAALLLLMASVLAAAVRLADHWLPVHLVQERHDLAVLAHVAMPVVFCIGLQPGRTVATQFAATPFAPSAAPAEAAQPALQSIPMVEPVAGAATAVPWTALALLLWGVVSAILLARTIRDIVQLIRLKAAADPRPGETLPRLSRPVDVRFTASIDAPMLVGYFQPVILLPAATDAHRCSRAVLEHEVGHAKRADAWTTLGLRLINDVFWWALPLRLLTPIIHRTREMLADSYAAEVTGAPVQLAHALLDNAAGPDRSQPPALAPGVRGAALPARVRRLGAAAEWRERRTWLRFSTMLPCALVVAWTMTPRLGEAQSRDEALDATSQTWSTDSGQTDLALYKAARRGQLERVRQLIAEGEDPSALSRGDGTPLMAAIRGRNDGRPRVPAQIRGRPECHRTRRRHGADRCCPARRADDCPTPARGRCQPEPRGSRRWQPADSRRTPRAHRHYRSAAGCWRRPGWGQPARWQPADCSSAGR